MSGVDPAFWRGRRVLITGHTGFKGAWLALWLQALGARVSGFALSAGAAAREQPSLFELARVGAGMDSVEGDVRDAGAVDHAVASVAPEVIVHLAAQSLVRHSLQDPRATYEANVMGTVNVLEAVRTRGPDVRVVISVTSDKCYENRGAGRAFAEEDALGGDDPYSSSKGCAELVTAAYRRSFFSDPHGPRVASARAGNVIGGGDWGAERLVPDVMRAALAGEEVRVRNPGAVRPWQHVLNPLSGYLTLAQAAWASQEHACAWNFGPDEQDALPVSSVVERLAALWPGELRWSVDSGAHPLEAHRLLLDSSRAHSRLGWRPLVGLDSALESVVAWYRALRERADMQAVTLSQIEAFQRLGRLP